jgi:hypothetical protein
MCYTASASAYSFIVGIIASSYLYSRPNIDLKIIGGIFFLVSFMQLFDYVFWTTKSKDTNLLFTKLAVIVNNIQPLVFAYLIYKYKGDVKGKKLVYLYGIVMVLYMMENWKLLSGASGPVNTTSVGPDGSLYWSWNHWEYSGYFYIFFLGMLLYLAYYNLSVPYNTVLPSIILLLFIVSYFKYGVEIYGRMWCYFAPFIPLVFLIIKN